jgi:hypothetical protein
MIAAADYSPNLDVITLIRNGANVDAKNYAGWAVLIHAEILKHTEI